MLEYIFGFGANYNSWNLPPELEGKPVKIRKDASFEDCLARFTELRVKYAPILAKMSDIKRKKAEFNLAATIFDPYMRKVFGKKFKKYTYTL